MPFTKGNRLWDSPKVKANQFKKGHQMHKKEAVIKECPTCKKTFTTIPSQAKRKNYCSLNCYYPNRNILVECAICKKEFHPQQSRYKFCSLPCYYKSLKNVPAKFSIALYMKDKIPWNRGKVLTIDLPEATRIRNSKEYWKWVEDVKKRDNYTCQICEARGVKLQADHVKPFALYPDLRLDINNGRALCIPCHKEVTRKQRRSIFKNKYASLPQ